MMWGGALHSGVRSTQTTRNSEAQAEREGRVRGLLAEALRVLGGREES